MAAYREEGLPGYQVKRTSLDNSRKSHPHQHTTQHPALKTT